MQLRAVAVFALLFFFASTVLINQVIGVHDFRFILVASGFGAVYLMVGWLWTESDC